MLSPSEFQAFVMLRRVTAMSQGSLQQLRVPEVIAQLSAQHAATPQRITGDPAP